MKVYSQLEKAQLENTTSSPSSEPAGMIKYRTDTNVAQVSDGSIYHSLVDTDSAQVLTAKDYDGGTASNTSRVTIPKAAFATLSGLTRKEGTLLYASDLQQMYYDTGSTLLAVGSGGSVEDIQSLYNLGLAVSVGSSALTIALKQRDGSSDPSGGNPVILSFRDATATNGNTDIVSATAATSLTISSGSTLGHASGQDHYIYVYAINNAGTIELAASSVIFDEGTLVSTTAEGGAGAADSNSVMYSDTARSNVACKLIGRILVNQTTAGTWDAAPDEVSLPPFKKQRVHAKYRQTTGGTTFPLGSNNLLDFATKIEDTHNAVSGAGSGSGGIGGAFRFYAPKDALYTFKCMMGLSGVSGFNGSSEYAQMALQIDGSVEESMFCIFPPSTATFVVMFGVATVRLTKGQYVTIDARNQSGNTSDTYVKTNNRNHYWFEALEEIEE